jgi:hypothetical protein
VVDGNGRTDVVFKMASSPDFLAKTKVEPDHVQKEEKASNSFVDWAKV